MTRAPYVCKISVLFIAVVSVLFGCAGIMPALTKPAVTVSNLRVEEIRPFETTLSVSLRIINPNEFPLTIRGVTCNVSLNGEKFGTGVSDTTVQIPPFETAVTPISVYSSMISLIRGFMKLHSKNQLSYEIEGALRIKAGNFPFSSFPFEHEGVVDMEHMKDMR